MSPLQRTRRGREIRGPGRSRHNVVVHGNPSFGAIETPDYDTNLVAFLASSRAHKMTGQAVNMTAGLLM